MSEPEQGPDVAAAAQALANAIGPRRPWVLVIDDPTRGELVYSPESIKRARSMLRSVEHSFGARRE